MWVSLFLISVLGIAAVGYVIWPLSGRSRKPISSEREELVDLITRKEVALETIRDLEFDHNVGKIEDEDFERFNRILRNRAMRLIERIDVEYGGSQGLGPQSVNISDRLELEIRNRRRVEEALPNEGSCRLPEE
ncbi:MAG: hypothetical protein F4148_04185 [Caldilineaceae bacterium SB0675_bin_29]|uniref:C-type cytochrome biogenesis protein CcmI n=1 Tax=Caldilineaceae bacterium SB0675_bin_29 TaxID=2605266 RepID=A0A6B1G4B0_9CHLR|nr:hypothetical protein [Caldilineaceae bacterium SB0675_bin_29]